MLPRFGFNQCREIVGRASAIIAIVGMASLIFAATTLAERTTGAAELSAKCQRQTFVPDRSDAGFNHAAFSTRVSISLRSISKSIGLVKSASAPPSNALRLVSVSP